MAALCPTEPALGAFGRCCAPAAAGSGGIPRGLWRGMLMHSAAALRWQQPGAAWCGGGRDGAGKSWGEGDGACGELPAPGEGWVSSPEHHSCCCCLQWSADH